MTIEEYFGSPYYGKPNPNNDIETESIRYAEHHGICEFHVANGVMVYYSTFPCERTTYKAVVDLQTWREHREPLKHYYKAYSGRIGGRYQANYMS